MKTSLMLSHGPAATGLFVRALLRIEGAPPADDATRAPLNLSLVIDRSGSMHGEPLEAVKSAAQELVKRLHPMDRVSVVAFDDQVQTLAAPGTAADQSGLSDAISRIQTGGMTNLSAGWLQGRQLLSTGSKSHEVNRLMLLSDGHANQGITAREALTGMAREAAEAGFSTTTIGVGSGFDEDLMTGMAEAGRGTTYYVESLDQAVGVFEEEILGLLSLSAQNISVSLQPHIDLESCSVLHSWPATPAEDGSLNITIGDLYAREPRELLIDFRMDRFEAEGPTPIAALTVEADVLTEDGKMEHRRISLPIEFDPQAGPVTHPEVEKTAILLRAAKARREAIERADDGDLSGAREVLREASILIETSGIHDDELALESRDLQSFAEEMEAKSTFVAEDRKYLRFMSESTGKGKRGAAQRGRRDR